LADNQAARERKCLRVGSLQQTVGQSEFSSFTKKKGSRFTAKA